MGAYSLTLGLTTEAPEPHQHGRHSSGGSLLDVVSRRVIPGVLALTRPSKAFMKSQLIILLLLLPAGSAAAPQQAKSWRVQFPCDRSFSVEVPAPLYEVSWFEGKHGPSFEPDENFEKAVRAFVALQGTPMRRQFGVVVEYVPREKRHAYQRRDFGGSYFVIGGDDATPTSEQMIRVNGLAGREYVYAKAVSEDTYTRGRIFYAAGRLYILVFVTTSAEDLNSPEAVRFLNSFRLRR